MSEEQQIIKPKALSFSEYHVWKGCEHKHYIKKVLRIPEPTTDSLAFGSALHSALESILKGEKPYITFKAVFKKNLIENLKQFSDSKLDINKESYYADNIFKELNFKVVFQDYDIIHVEEDIFEPLISIEEAENINIKETFFKGFIDLVLQHKITKEYLIIDWKSSLRNWSLEKKLEDKVFFGQLGLYKIFKSRKLNIPRAQIKTRFITLSKMGRNTIEFFDINFSDIFLDNLLTDFIQSAKDIQTKKDFFKAKEKYGKNAPACLWCHYKNSEYCP